MKVEFGVEKHQPAVTEGFAVRDEERRGGAYKKRGGAYKKRGGAYKGRGWGLQREGVGLTKGGGRAYKGRRWSQRQRKIVHIMWDGNRSAFYRSDKLTNQ